MAKKAQKALQIASPNRIVHQTKQASLFNRLIQIIFHPKIDLRETMSAKERFE